jgi:predicted RNase H-like HicB family nuclease
MDKHIFPALFEPNPNGGYSVSFPDLPGCISYGITLEETLRASREALELHLYGMEEEGLEIPSPSAPESVTLESGEFCTVIVAWMPQVRSGFRNRSVKKTLTLPHWLNEIAEKEGINFSQLLQQAIKEQLGLR